MSPAVQTLRLEKAVFCRGRYIREVAVRAPTQADLQEAGGARDTDLERGIYLVAKVCNLLPAAIRKLSDNDMARLAALVDNALPPL